MENNKILNRLIKMRFLLTFFLILSFLLGECSSEVSLSNVDRNDNSNSTIQIIVPENNIINSDAYSDYQTASNRNNDSKIVSIREKKSLLPQFIELFPIRVKTEIVPIIEIPSHLIIGFSSDSNKFILCGINSYIDFKSCKIIDVKTGVVHKVMASVDGYEWDEVADKKLQELLAKMKVQNRVIGEWQFQELRIVWDNMSNDYGKNSLSVWIEHISTGLRIKVDSYMALDYTGVNLLGIIISPDTLSLSIVYHITEVGDIEYSSIKIIPLRVLIKDLYIKVGSHYMMSTKWHTAFKSFQIPNSPILLGDKIGSTGTYIVSATNNKRDGSLNIQYGRTFHLEVFTTENPLTFLRSPWIDKNNREENPNADNIVADLNTVDRFINDAAGDGIDLIDIKNAATSLRNLAIRNKSEWSVQSKDELTQEVIVSGQRHQIGQVISDSEFREHIQPLTFHSEMVGRPGANANIIGPFFGETQVWHLHPFTFLKWMNERVDRHEKIMSEQDKPRNPLTSNITVQNSYVTGFQNIPGANSTQLPQRTPANAGNSNVFPEIRYSDNSFEVSIDMIADQAELERAPQNTTRFHYHLLEALDMINDRPHGAIVIEGYVSTNNVQCSDNSRIDLHKDGRAMDLRPASGTNIADWYNLYASAVMAKDFMEQAYSDNLEILITTDPSPTGGVGPNRAELDQNATELLRRVQVAQNSGDAILTQSPVVQQLDRMRLHYGFKPAPDLPTSANLNNVVWLNIRGEPFVGSLMPDIHLKLRVTTRGLSNGTTLNFFIFSRFAMNRNPRDIRDSNTLQNIYGNLTFNLDDIEQHEMRPNCLDHFYQRVQKQVTGVNDSGEATVTADWIVPRSFPRGISSLYMVCIAPSGSSLVAGGMTSEHVIISSTTEIYLPMTVS